MRIIKEIYLSLYDQPVIKLYAKEGDNGRYIKVTILDNATVYTIPSDATARIASGEIWNNCTISDNSVLACLTPDMLKPGVHAFQIELMQGQTKLTTVSGILNVEKSARNDTAIEGSTEFGVLDKVITEAQKITKGVENAEVDRNTAEIARVSAENTRKSQENGRVNAEAARVTAFTTLKTDSESATATANTAATNADNKATAAQAAAANADSKAQACQTATTAANTARDAANAAATNANNKATAANTAATNANAARDAANTAATNANNKATLANTAATAANSAAEKANAAAGGDISQKTVAYTESTGNTAPPTGSKLSAIIGWLAGKTRNILSKLTSIDKSIAQLGSDTHSLTKINAIEDGADLNDEKFTVPGIWTCDSSSKAATIKNCPYTESGFRLIIEYLGVPWIARQTFVCQNDKSYTFKRRVFQTDGIWNQNPWHCNDTEIGEITTRVNQLNSDLLLINAHTDIRNGSTFGKNFMLLSAATPGGTGQISAYFEKPVEDGEWQNTPSTMKGKLWLGYRQVYRRDSDHAMIQIVELYPTPGRNWYNFYNVSTWSGWKTITPQ